LGLLKKDLEGYSQTLSALHFTEEKPLTKKIIKLLVDTKLQQIAEGYHAKKKKIGHSQPFRRVIASLARSLRP
jgi:hypothetical protein